MEKIDEFVEVKAGMMNQALQMKELSEKKQQYKMIL